METSMPGVFAAGDVRRGAVKRVASAAGEGSIAIQTIHEYLDNEASGYGGSQRGVWPEDASRRGPFPLKPEARGAERRILAM
jgi:hypothetical protein